MATVRRGSRQGVVDERQMWEKGREAAAAIIIIIIIIITIIHKVTTHPICLVGPPLSLWLLSP